MKKYGFWTKLLHIPESPPNLLGFQLHFSPLYISSRGGSRILGYNHNVFWYDYEKQTVEMYEVDLVHKSRTIIVFTESLVPIPGSSRMRSSNLLWL